MTFNSITYDKDDPLHLNKKFGAYTDAEKHHADLFILLKLISVNADIISFFASSEEKLNVAKDEIANLMKNIKILTSFDERFKLNNELYHFNDGGLTHKHAWQLLSSHNDIAKFICVNCNKRFETYKNRNQYTEEELNVLKSECKVQ